MRGPTRKYGALGMITYRVFLRSTAVQSLPNCDCGASADAAAVDGKVGDAPRMHILVP